MKPGKRSRKRTSVPSKKKTAAPRKPKARYTLADVHRHCGADLVEVLEETRHLILDTVPNVQERIYSEGRGIGYFVPGVGVRFGIFFTPRSVALVFVYGKLLPDPEGLIGSHAKKSSWVDLRPGKPFPHESLARLLLASVLE